MAELGNNPGQENNDQDDNDYESAMAKYLEQRRRAKERDAAKSAFNMWENEVRNDLHYYNEWN